jgi:hypothetical protein
MITGLSHSGTEKSLQLIAEALCNDYHVYFMYGDMHVDLQRKSRLNPNITLLPFLYDQEDTRVPHLIRNMRPHLKTIAAENAIDLLITSSPGYSHYPWNLLTKFPIVHLNIFGAPSLQKNIAATVYISQTTKRHASQWTGPKANEHVRYLPCNAAPANTRAMGQQLRKRLGIDQGDFVFGRIGRADNNIYDPIGINAWKRIVHKYEHAHFLIQSPPPILVSEMEETPIPRIHLLPPSGGEDDIWAFHGALDAMAHFRHDGETSGVAIAESLMAGNPVITHRSHIWNAHLEYLTPDCSRAAGLDNDEEYAAYMEEFISIRDTAPGKWSRMKRTAETVAKENFDPDSFGEFFRELVKDISMS